MRAVRLNLTPLIPRGTLETAALLAPTSHARDASLSPAQSGSCRTRGVTLTSLQFVCLSSLSFLNFIMSLQFPYVQLLNVPFSCSCTFCFLTVFRILYTENSYSFLVCSASLSLLSRNSDAPTITDCPLSFLMSFQLPNILLASSRILRFLMSFQLHYVSSASPRPLNFLMLFQLHYISTAS